MPMATIKSSVLERFLRYVKYDTRADESSSTYPSTPGQLVLLDKLAEELQEIGLEDVVRDKHGYVFATIPATTRKRTVPVIGFIAHVDTSPEAPGADVKPIIHRKWKGQDIVLPDDPTAVLRWSGFSPPISGLGNWISSTGTGASKRTGSWVDSGVSTRPTHVAPDRVD